MLNFASIEKGNFPAAIVAFTEALAVLSNEELFTGSDRAAYVCRCYLLCIYMPALD